MLNICIVAGARPNFIKVAPIVRAIEKARDEGKDIGYELLYAGRADDPTLEGTLFDDLQIANDGFLFGSIRSESNDIARVEVQLLTGKNVVIAQSDAQLK